MHGKMGISICFFHLARQAGNKIFEDYAGELIDEIYDEISVHTPVDFENGLAGIGWGIEYLVHNGFIEKGEYNVLEELDNVVFQLEKKQPKLTRNPEGFYAYGLYYLCRAKNDVWNTEVLQLIWNDIKELFSANLQEEKKICPDYLISLVYFLQEIKKSSCRPSDADKVIAALPSFISGLYPLELNSCEFYYLQNLLQNPGFDLPLLNGIYTKLPVSEKLPDASLSQVAAYELLFPAIKPFSDCNPEYRNKIHTTLTDPGIGETFLETTDDKKYGIYSGLAGYVLTLLNEGYIEPFKHKAQPPSDGSVYIFKRKSRASEYGIGTYIKEITTGLKKSGQNITIIQLEAEKPEFTIENQNGILNWYIPIPRYSMTKNINYNHYILAVVYLMRLHTINTCKIIFHLNCMRDYQLAKYLREFFDECKILLVVHYMDWSFVLKGDLSQLKKILAQDRKSTRLNS